MQGDFDPQSPLVPRRCTAEDIEMREGDVVIGVASSGVSNGWPLVRRVVSQAELRMTVRRSRAT